MRQLLLLNPENLNAEEIAKLYVRETSRAVIFDANNTLALLDVTKLHYHKLPGGGAEAGETIIEALKRECLEETGCDIEIVSELGSVTEYRQKLNLKQTSHCYIARVVGKKDRLHLEPSEVDEGFELMWVPLDEAIELISQDQPSDYEGTFIVKRDLCFLQAAEKMAGERH